LNIFRRVNIAREDHQQDEGTETAATAGRTHRVFKRAGLWKMRCKNVLENYPQILDEIRCESESNFIEVKLAEQLSVVITTATATFRFDCSKLL